MFNKIISKFKKPDEVTPNAAELAALASIDTLEKAVALVAQLETAKSAADHQSARYKLLYAQHEQANIAVRRHMLDAERTRAASVMLRDQNTIEKALSSADAQLTDATLKLKVERAKIEAIAARIKPIEEELQANRQDAQTLVSDLQSEFDAAIAKDDADASKTAANKLFLAQQDCTNSSPRSGPLVLLVDALRREFAAGESAIEAAEKAVADATQAQLSARADLAMLAYDRKAAELLEAWANQVIAVRSAASSLWSSNGTLKSLVGSAPVSMFEAQFSSTERIVHGTWMDVYNQRHYPSHAGVEIVNAMRAPPDLAILAANVDDLPPEPLDAVEEEIVNADAAD